MGNISLIPPDRPSLKIFSPRADTDTDSGLGAWTAKWCSQFESSYLFHNEMTKSNLCLHNLWSAKTVVCFWGEETDLMRFGGPPDLNFVKKLKLFSLFKEESAHPADAPSLRNGYVLVHCGNTCFIAVCWRFIEENHSIARFSLAIAASLGGNGYAQRHAQWWDFRRSRRHICPTDTFRVTCQTARNLEGSRNA